ncbi:MAG: mannose-1-phosphate guanylyltransferase/mannose-6-phosphate isomerase [Syntrophales bacterium]
MSQNLYSVVLAGGSGTRFWPLSREKMPKQFLQILGDRSMFSMTLDRVRALVPDERILIVTIRSQADEVRRELYNLDASRMKILEEPVGRNTAAAIGLACVHILQESPRGILAVFPADHYIRDESRFLDIMRHGFKAADGGWLVTLGIRPVRPETGYGYIMKGDLIDPEGSENRDRSLFRAERFTEKPDRRTAEEYLRSGRFYWNGGIFCWRADVLMDEIKRYLPSLHEGLFSIQKSPERLNEIYPTLESVSVDYGILEHSDRVAMIPADVGWSDVGSWEALYDLLGKDQEGNVVRGDVVTVGSRRSLIRSEDRLVAAVGADDLIIVETSDAVLVCRKDMSQDIRAIAQHLIRQNRREALVRPLVLKPWGAYKILDEGNGYQVKWLDIRPGQRLSLQSHRFRSEHWTVVAGTATATLDDRVLDVPAGKDIFIPFESRHRVENRLGEMLRIIEVQTGSYLGEDDIVRYEDDYGRAGRS